MLHKAQVPPEQPHSGGAEGICHPDAISTSALYYEKEHHLNPEKTKGGQLPQGWHFKG